MTQLDVYEVHRHHDPVSGVLPDVVNALVGQNGRLATTMRRTYTGHLMPSRTEIVQMVDLLREVIFPGYFGSRDVTEASLAYHMGATLDRIAIVMTDEIHRGLCFACSKDPQSRSHQACFESAQSITSRFMTSLPEIRRLLALDAVAAYEGDPACTSPAEAIFCYPGLQALTSHRIAHELHRLDVPLIPRIIAEHAHSTTGIDIHPGARIGEKCFIDHGTGVVVGETCIVGDRVRIYQGVTLGARRFPKDEDGNPIKGIARHPVIEDNVTIYSGATILGRVTIGEGSVIGGNVWLTRSVPPGSQIAQARPIPEVFSAGGGI